MQRVFNHFYCLGLFLLLALLSTCTVKKKVTDWNTPLPAIGTQSSPRCTDLTGDGILDIVMGAGMNEYIQTNQGVIALNGKNGSLLWAIPATDQIVGSPAFIDISGDGINDIVIGGRSHNLLAINGKSGEIIWRYNVTRDQGIKELARFNFFNCQIVRDVNGDGLKDILAACGGNAKASPYSMQGRYPGTLMILDARSGDIMAMDTMPDGLENYMSPVLIKENEMEYILYGTGGETFGGNFYKVRFDDLLQSDLTGSKLLIHNPKHGFIAPPTLADVNNDSINDIILSGHDGIVYCIDGFSDSLIWKREMNLEANNMLAPGYYNQDSVIDFFGYFTAGAWPENDGIVEFVLDGRDGNILFRDSVGSTGFSSPISFQADSDPETEVLIHINFGKPNTMNYEANRSQLILYDFPEGKRVNLDTLQHFKNISTTPWLGDLDGDHKMELVTVYLLNTYKIHEVGGMYISMKKTDWKINGRGTWREYMGKDGSALFKP